MKIQVKTRIEPLYKIPIIDKILSPFRHVLPVIEGYEALFDIKYKDEDSGEAPVLSIKPVFRERQALASGTQALDYGEWIQANAETFKFRPSLSGYVEWEVYFKDLKDTDSIIDDYGVIQKFTRDIGADKNIRHYRRPFRVYSLSEVTMLLFTGVVTVFTILLFIITMINFILLY